MNTKNKTDAITATPSSSLSTPSKPIVTTAPSKTAITTMPALKQKTGIIKSKVPPPVPPRGSPRDRRSGNGSHKSGVSPRGTPPSSGSVNYLNDKHKNVTRLKLNANCDNKNEQFTNCKSPVPVRTAVTEQILPTALILRPLFGERRSPTCVRDWLEVNDFGASDFDRKIIEWARGSKAAAKARKPISIKTAILQRENSFKNISNSSGSVKSLTQNFEAKNQPIEGQSATIPTEKESIQDAAKSQISIVIKPRIRKRGTKVPMSRLNWLPGSSELDDEFGTSQWSRRNVVYDSTSRRRDMSPMPDFIKRESLYDDYREAELIFNTIQPERGRHGFASDVCESAKPFKLYEALSNLDVNDNFSSQCLDSFCAEQFV